LIILAKTGWLDLLRLIGDPVHVPMPVVDEIQQGGPSDPAVEALATKPWLTVVPAAKAPAQLLKHRLGRGEESVLAWALAHPGSEAILDDQAARRCARVLGVPVRSCLSLVLIARQQGVIASARPVVESMCQAGLRLSDRVMNQALGLVNE
jgi:predicted nucleic acid-binding protein